jgi:hypothetical protein
LDLTSTNSLRNRFNYSLLRWFLSFVNDEDVWLVKLVVDDSLGDSGEITNMDGWNEVVTLADDGQFFWRLLPSIFEMVKEHALSMTVSNTTAQDVNLEKWLCLWG